MTITNCKMSTSKRASARRSDDTMDDDSDDKDSKRKSRNLSEKKRRDQFNLLVNELSSMVSTGSRKMDKSTVLKSTISFLKNHNEIAVRSRVHEIQENWKPTFLTNEEFTHLILEAVDGFIIVFSTSGQIFYVSESVTSLLGHLPNDLLTTTIYEVACEEEQNELYNKLIEPNNDGERQTSFSCHLRRGEPMNKQPNSYELVHFSGYFRPDSEMTQTDNSRYSGYSGEADTRLVFVGTGRLQTPQLIRETPLIDSGKIEFTSRHSLEWKFLFLDHRAPPIIGYLPFELLGTSGYDYYHIDDLDKVVSCHEALMQKGEGTSCYYRFLTKGQQWIWLQTRFYITYHQWNSKPEFIVCTHRVVSYVDVMKRNKFEDTIILYQESSPNSDNVSCAAWKPSSKSRPAYDPSSDCTSMSADSPASRHSALTQLSVKSRASRQANTPTQSTSTPTQSTSRGGAQPVQSQSSSNNNSFMEPPQYVATIPMQPIIASFPQPAVLSPLPPVEGMLSPAQNQLQADLQRKHAELQVLIGQQQAELRRVSEQLLMARLGLLPPTQNENQAPVSYNNSETVSSTTAMASVPGPQIIVPVTIPVTQQQQNIPYSPHEEK
ncbi:circadian locomoter output cycles protein kaput [Onthophagus taurus]|uniref:circadian locomoter output cycles protein kaput n=1 Tax=Onthophagus taurus TaxID=166361 RepID=UPI0039BE9BFB